MYRDNNYAYPKHYEVKEKWRKEIEYEYLQAIKRQSYDVKEFFVVAEKIADRYFETGEIKDGDEFEFGLGFFLTHKLVFHKNYTELYGWSLPEVDYVLQYEKGKARDFEKRNFVGFISDIICHPIAERTPNFSWSEYDKFREGGIYNFDNGNTYSYTRKKDNSSLTFKLIKRNNSVMSTDSFECIEDVKMPWNDKNNQDFYNQNKTNANNMEYGHITYEAIQVYFDDIYSKLDKGKTRKLTYGPITLYVDKTRIQGRIKWYDSSSNRISEDRAKYIYGYFATLGLKRTFRRDMTTPCDYVDDNDCDKKFEKYIGKHRYEEALATLSDHVAECKGELKICVKGYRLEDDNYIATGYMLAYRDDKVKIYKMAYDNNDVNATGRATNETLPEEVLNFFHQVYDKGHTFLKSIEQTNEDDSYDNPFSEAKEKEMRRRE